MTAINERHGQLDTGYPHTLRPELHKALMARGIDYWVAQGITFWNRDDGCECLAYGYKADGVPKLAIKVVGFTDPEQAIAATLDDTDATGGRRGDADLAAKNAKLRELLSEIAKLVTNPYGGCLRPGCAHGCPHHLECDEELHTCFYVDRIRELGVEVD